MSSTLIKIFASLELTERDLSSYSGIVVVMGKNQYVMSCVSRFICHYHFLHLWFVAVKCYPEQKSVTGTNFNIYCI